MTLIAYIVYTKNNSKVIASAVKQHKPISLAVFDVDWTLIAGTSAEALLIKFLKTKGQLKVSNFARSAFFSVQNLHNGIIEAFLKNKYYLFGLDAESLLKQMDEFHEDWMKPRFSQNMLDQISRYRENRTELVLLSGTLDFIIHTLCRKLNIPNGIGAQVEIQNGKFTGRIKGIYPIHHRKIVLLERYFDGIPINWSNSAAFGDSTWDIPILNRVGHPIAVHPDRGLLRESRRRHWPIEKRIVSIQNPFQRLWVERILRR